MNTTSAGESSFTAGICDSPGGICNFPYETRLRRAVLELRDQSRNPSRWQDAPRRKRGAEPDQTQIAPVAARWLVSGNDVEYHLMNAPRFRFRCVKGARPT